MPVRAVASCRHRALRRQTAARGDLRSRARRGERRRRPTSHHGASPEPGRRAKASPRADLFALRRNLAETLAHVAGTAGRVVEE